jgi:ethanolamine utilization microcompartment shell protein EutL
VKASREILVEKVSQIDHHRNGIAGCPFDVVTFTMKDEGKRRNMVAVVFDKPGYCAVLDADMAAAGDVTFGVNSWRGDDFEAELRPLIRAWYIDHYGYDPEAPEESDT